MPLVGGDTDVGDPDRQTRDGRALESELLHVVEDLQRRGSPQPGVGVVNDPAAPDFAQRAVVERHAVGQHVAEQDPSHRGHEAAMPGERFDQPGFGLDHLAEARQSDHDPLLEVDLAQFQGQDRLVGVLESGQLLLRNVAVGGGRHRQEVHAHHDVLTGRDDRLAVRRRENLVRREHQHVGLSLGLNRERKMHRHLIAVEVGVIPGADQRVDHDRVALDQHRLERLNSHPVQRRGTVQQHRVLVDHLLQDVPDFRVPSLQHALGALDRVRQAVLLELANDERLVQLQRDLLGQAALVQLQLRTDHDHRTSRVVHPLAQQVFAEATLLALDHVGERLQRTVARAEHRTPAPAVVEQRVHGLLKHPLLVANNHFRRVEVHQLFEAIVAVDNPPVQIVQVPGGEVAALQQHEGAVVRRADRDHVHHHPRWIVGAEANLLHELEPFGQVLGLLLAAGVVQILTKLVGQVAKVQLIQQFADCLRPHQGGESRRAELFYRFPVIVFSQHLLQLQLARSRLGRHVILEVDDLLQVRGLHPQQRPEPAGQRLEEPDVHDRGRQIDVPHALAADPRVGHLHAAAIADDALVLRAFVLAAGALVVALGPEDALAKEPVLLRTIRAVIDRLGFLHFAEAPTADVVGAGHRDLYRPEIVDAIVDVVSHK